MAGRSPHIAAWKERLRTALTNEAQATSALVEATAVPRGSAQRLLEELREDGVAVKTVMPWPIGGSSFRPTGWRLREAFA